MKNFFTNPNMSYKKMIILSLIFGILPGIIIKLPFLNGLSIQDISVVFDIWIILALYIILNSKDVKDAIIKCFLFFLISQPLIYLTETIIDVLFNNKNILDCLNLYFKNYYIGAGWLKWTILTIPGSFIAYEIKKQNIISSLILSVATIYYAYMGTTNLLNHYHYLSAIFCLIMAFLLIFIILKNKKERIISLVLTTITIIISIILFNINKQKPIFMNELIDSQSGLIITNVTIENENIATYQIEENNLTVSISTSKEVGTTKMIITDEKNNEYTYIVESTSKGLKITLENKKEE